MSNIETIYNAVRSLPMADRLRLIERVVHDAVAASEKADPPTEAGKASILGLFADEPDLIDTVCAMAMEDRAQRSLRSSDE